MAEKVQPDFAAAENKPVSAICVLKAIIRYCWRRLSQPRHFNGDSDKPTNATSIKSGSNVNPITYFDLYWYEHINYFWTATIDYL